MLGAALALAGIFGSGAASAQNTYSAYVDTDNNPSTGCTITLPGGTFQGADARVQATAVAQIRRAIPQATVGRRLRIILDWTVALFFRPDITRVGLRVERELEQHAVRARGGAQVAAGDQIRDNS